MKKLEIEIPDNKEIDWAESAKQEKIVFKNKQLTYKDVCEELFCNGHYFTDANGDPRFKAANATTCPNNASTVHQLECILAKNKLTTVARYLNGEWCTEDFENDPKWVIFLHGRLSAIEIKKVSSFTEHTNVMFKSQELAQQAVEILGKDTITLALEPLY